MVPAEARLSTTVGIFEDCEERVPSVRSTGPIPRIPSTPLNPVALEATPIDWPLIVRPDPRVTVSVYSSPEKEPDPYETDYSNGMLVMMTLITLS